MTPFFFFRAGYDEAALTRPVAVKAATSAVCYFLGDCLAQSLSRPTGAAARDPGQLDLARAARSAGAGFVGHGPVAHYWLAYLDGLSFGGGGFADEVPKILLDQGPMSLVYNTLYTTLIGAFASRAPREIAADVRATWLPGMAVSVRFWPFVHLVTFSALIPSELKLLWVDVCEIAWIGILAQVNGADPDGGDEVAAAPRP